MGICTSHKNKNYGRLGSSRDINIQDMRFATTKDFKIDLLSRQVGAPPNINEDDDEYIDHYSTLANGTIKCEILITGYIRDLIYSITSSYSIPYIVIQSVKMVYYPQYIALEIGATNESFYSTFRISQLLSSSSSIHYNGPNDKCYIATIYDEIYCTDAEPRKFRKINKFINNRHYVNDAYVDVISHGISNQHLFICTVDPYNNDQLLYCCGHNAFGQCGCGLTDDDDDQSIIKWTKITNNFVQRIIDSDGFVNIDDRDKIYDIKCGVYHTLFLTLSGNVWSTGQNWYGQLGLNSDIRKTFKPQLIKFNPDKYGRITPFNSTTDLDNCNSDDNKSDVHVNKPVKIMKISCGDSHNLCVDENDELWIFGHIALHNDMKESIYEPILYPYFQKQVDAAGPNDKNNNNNNNNNNIRIVSINCGSDHSVCCDNNGLCYLFGTNDKGQIGHKYMEIQFKPFIFQQSTDDDNKNKFIFSNIKIINVECGSCHTVLLTDTNDVITFGSNHYKQCSTIIKDEIVFFGHKLLRHEEIGITHSTYIERIIASSNSTILVVNMAKKLKILR